MATSESPLPIDVLRTEAQLVGAHHLNAQLPLSYALTIKDERETLIQSIDELHAAVASGDLQRGANFHAASIRRFLALKHALSSDERVKSIHLLYELVTADLKVPLNVRRRWCALLTKLLRKCKHVYLALPWRPLLDKLMQYAHSKLRVAEFASRSTAHSHLSALAKLAAQARRHFEPGSSAGILAAVEPLLCPKDPRFFSGAALLSLLLPTHGEEGQVRALGRRQHANTGARGRGSLAAW